MAEQEVLIPDLGGVDEVALIEIFVAPGDRVQKDQSLVALESEKASMEVPAPYEGIVKSLQVKVGDKVKEGQVILLMTTTETAVEKIQKTTEASPKKSEPTKQMSAPIETTTEIKSLATIHAGPAVRRFARELGADLALIKGTGVKQRILKEDVMAFVKQALTAKSSAQNTLPEIPEVNFSKYGEVEVKQLSRIKTLTAANMFRNWVNIPHVTQFDEADITQLEVFRKEQAALAKEKNIKLTLLAFLVKVAISALREFPQFNVSLNRDKQSVTLKKYFHIGIAVDTAEGLMVPVIRNADQKSLLDIAKEIAELSDKARTKSIKPAEMQGGCFTISSLGSIGGTGFTPIINAPEVAILGVSKATKKPIYNEQNALMPRLMLPLALSYDHRVIDGVEGGKFMAHLTSSLSDIKKILL